ncbi:hypothetical protein LAWI1_G002508 [Lachnellula willkommii]|uniref:Rhodopsin domain-containing protein n=1 Tax=Lachnellula willkommii TaxID=215461 RepID=A0A559MJH8_9HELO|nr:hypothetical protein LAWI1_G002508 [Lachnellula willkommii]
METEKAPSSLPGLGLKILSTGWAGCAMGTIMFGMRIYVNAAMARKWDTALWLALATYFACLAATVVMTLSVKNGLGDHMSDLEAWSPDSIREALRYRWYASGVCIVSLGLAKLSIINYLITVQGDTLKAKPIRKWFMYFLAYSNLLLCIGMTLVLWTQCKPTNKLWDVSIKGQCSGRRRYQICAYFWSSYEGALDMVLSLYPITIFWNLKLPTHIKIGLVLLFATGIL